MKRQLMRLKKYLLVLSGASFLLVLGQRQGAYGYGNATGETHATIKLVYDNGRPASGFRVRFRTDPAFETIQATTEGTADGNGIVSFYWAFRYWRPQYYSSVPHLAIEVQPVEGMMGYPGTPWRVPSNSLNVSWDNSGHILVVYPPNGWGYKEFKSNYQEVVKKITGVQASESVVEEWFDRTQGGRITKELTKALVTVTASQYVNRRSSNEDYIEDLYWHILHRPSDPGGKRDHVNFLNTCAATKEQCRIQRMGVFVSSPEYNATKDVAITAEKLSQLLSRP